MTLISASWLAVLPALVFLCPANPAHAQSSSPSFFRNQFVGADFFLAIRDPVTNQWTRVEVSSDLNEWSELVNLFATDDCCNWIYTDDSAHAVDHRFYRVTSPGTTVQEARARWESLSVNSYRFDVEYFRWNSGQILTGTVTVDGDHKFITNVQINFEPATAYDPSEFRTFDEIFDFLEENTSRGVRIAWAQYHPTLNHPLRCFINTGTFAPEPDTRRYVITNFLPFLDPLSED